MYTNVYIAMALVAVAIIALLFVFMSRKNKSQKKKLSKLEGLAVSLIVAGIVFGEDRLIGYGLMGGGVLLAVIDMIMELRDKNAE